jgi:hypothetical protein
MTIELNVGYKDNLKIYYKQHFFDIFLNKYYFFHKPIRNITGLL